MTSEKHAGAAAKERATRSNPLSEHGIIERISQRLDQSVGATGSAVQLGIGDDAALLRLGPQDSARRLNSADTVLTTDLLVEGVHFDLRYMSLADAGYKALAVSLSDCAAMGSVPRYALGQLGVPRTATAEQIDALLDGVAAAQDMALAASAEPLLLIGGDTVAAPQWILGFTVLADLQGAALTRSGARPGDLLWCSAGIGLAQCGLHVLWGSSAPRPKLKRGDYPEAVAAHARPMAQLELGRWLQREGLASACLDLSDSLSQSLLLLAQASGVGLVVDLRQPALQSEVSSFIAAMRSTRRMKAGTDAAIQINVPAGMSPSGKAQSHSSQAEYLLASAEDYGLMFSAPASATKRLLRDAPAPLMHIGTVQEAAEGLYYIDETGRSSSLQASGYQHL